MAEKKKAVCFALGGHIANQNATFHRLREVLPEYDFYGGIDGFKCFETMKVQDLRNNSIDPNFAGSVFGAGRDSLTTKTGKIDKKKVPGVIEFFRRGKFDIAFGSGGDDHGMQMKVLEGILNERSAEIGREVRVFVPNKTMDNDLGGKDGVTDFTNGFHTAVSVGVRELKDHFAGAWTSNSPYLIGVFGRDADWTGAAVSYFGNADRFIHGELRDNEKPHSLKRIKDLIVESQNQNERRYGRRFAMVIVAEGTRIRGIKHVDSDLKDAHGHDKLNPEVLVVALKKSLKERYGIKTQTLGITYEMRNSPPTREDINYAHLSAEAIAKAVREGKTGLESVFKIRNGRVYADVAPIEEVSQKRLVRDYAGKPLINPVTMKVTEEMGRYYQPLFGKREPLASWLPSKPRIISLR